MQKKYRILIVILALAVIAGGNYWLTHKPETPKQVATDTVDPKDLIYVYKNDKETLASIIVRPKNGTPTRLNQKNGEWTVDISYPEEDLVKSTVRAAGATALQMIADRIIEENPQDLSVYGLDSPSIQVDFISADGTKTTFDVGNRNPAGNKYYVKMAGGNTVYLVIAFGPKNFDFSFEDLRNKQIQFSLNNQGIRYCKIVNNGETVIVVPAEEEDRDLMGQKTSQYKIVSPYAPHSVSADKMSTLLQAIPKVITVAEFIDDYPKDYSQYGLNPPVRTFIAKDDHSTLTLRIGNKTPAGNYYAMVDNDPKVIALSPFAVDPLFQFSAFDLLDKFILLINIKSADRIFVTIDGRTYTCEITRLYDGKKDSSDEEKEPDTNYFIDGLEIEEKPFKTFYQSLIGPLADSENPWDTPLKDPEITIEYTLNDGPVRNPKVEFVRINRNFYAAFVNGKSNFLVSAYQMEAIKDNARAALQSAE